VVSSWRVIAAAKALMITVDQVKLAEFGGYMNFSKSWAHSELHQMGYVWQKPQPQRAR